jgi:hypothetical protein
VIKISDAQYVHHQVAYHIIECASDKNCADAPKETKEQSKADNGTDVLGKCKPNENEREAQEGTAVYDFTSDKFAEGCQHHRRDGTREVEGEETKLTHNLGYTEFLAHATDTRTVCCRSQANEECHQVQHGGYTAFVPWVPIERVLFVASGKSKADVFLSFVLDHFCQGQWHVALHRLNGATV